MSTAGTAAAITVAPSRTTTSVLALTLTPASDNTVVIIVIIIEEFNVARMQLELFPGPYTTIILFPDMNYERRKSWETVWTVTVQR